MSPPPARRTPAAAGLLAGVLALGLACESKKVPEPEPPSRASAPESKPQPSTSASASPAGSAPKVAAESPPAAGSDAAAPGADGPPSGLPRFGWKAPIAVAVEEDVDQGDKPMQFSYLLDVCPGDKGGVLVTHRNVTVSRIDGASTAGKDKTPEIRQIEAAASALPTMVIDRNGAFRRGTGYEAMIKRANASFPGEEYAELRKFMASGKAPIILDLTLEQLWQAWVGVWLRFDPSRGAEQDDADVDAGPAASLIHMSFAGRTPDHHVKLVAHRVPTRDELVKLAGATNGPGAEVEQGAVLDWTIETEWPDVRPWRAHSRRSATMTLKGQPKMVAENHAYRFDWSPEVAGKPQCGAK